MHSIFFAASSGNLELVTRYLDLGVDVKSPQAITALRSAAIHGHLAIVNLLLDRGVDINCRSGRNNATPLIGASVNNQLEVASLLIARGANIELMNDSNQTPLSLAISAGLISMASLLIRNGAKIAQAGRSLLFSSLVQVNINMSRLLRDTVIEDIVYASYYDRDSLNDILRDHCVSKEEIRAMNNLVASSKGDGEVLILAAMAMFNKHLSLHLEEFPMLSTLSHNNDVVNRAKTKCKELCSLKVVAAKKIMQGIATDSFTEQDIFKLPFSSIVYMREQLDNRLFRKYTGLNPIEISSIEDKLANIIDTKLRLAREARDSGSSSFASQVKRRRLNEEEVARV